MALDLSKLSDEELQSIASGNLKDLSEETLKFISGEQKPAGAVAPVAINSGPETAEKFQTEADAKRAAIVQGFEESSKKDATTNPMTMEGVLTSTPALVTGAAVLGVAAGYGVPKIYKSVKERMMSKGPEPIKIDPIGFESFADMTPTPTTAPAPNPLGQTNLTPEDIQARAAQLKAPVAPGATPTVAELDAAFAAQQPISTPITAAPIDAPAPTPSAAPNSPVTSIVTDTVKEMIQETPAQPTDITKPVAAPVVAPQPVAPPVYPKTGTKFKTEADIPPGFVARYDVGNLDRSMGNILGLEHRAYARDLFNEGKPFGQSANLNKDVSELTKKYFQQLQGEIPETILGREARQAQKIPSEFGVFSKNTPFGAGVTIGGKAATLFAIPHIANAAQQGNYGSAALQAADVATDYLPFVGQIKQALSPSSAGEGSTLSPDQMQLQQNAMLLGSPYAQTELAKKRRQALEYAAKVGGGRGLTPASAYQR